MATEDDDFKYDPEGEDNVKKYRLPFALCKANGIAIQDWWTPKDAWAALRGEGAVDDVSEEYKEYFRNLKKLQTKANQQKYKERAERKKAQLENPDHNPDKNYIHQKGAIDGVKAGKPMSFEEADSGSVNPYFGSEYIGYAHNCQTCVATYIARRNGYDVRALPNLNNKAIYQLSYNTSLAYITDKGTHPDKISKPMGEGNLNFIDRTINANEIYSVEFSWKGRRQGHIITVEKLDDGNLRFYDPQTNKQFSEKDATSYFAKTKDLKLTNLTNCKIDEEFADKIMKKNYNKSEDSEGTPNEQKRIKELGIKI